MAGNYLSNPSIQWLDANGDPINGGTVEFFEAGATTTPQDTFSDSALTIANPNPITLDSDGRASENIFLQQLSYNVVVKDSGGSVIPSASRDDVSNILQVDLTGLATIATYAVARAILGVTMTAGDRFFIETRANDGDGGFGTFYWDAASVVADDDGTVLKLTDTVTGRLTRDFDGTIDVRWYGALLDGSTDDSVAVIAAGAALVNGNTLLFPKDTCVLESTVTNPGDATANSHGVLLSSLTAVHVDASGCLLKQTATSSKTGHSGGIVAFRNCTDCSFEGKGIGVTNAPTFTTMSAALVAAVGGCDGIFVKGEMTGGRAIFQSLSDDLTATGTTNKNMFVNGIGHICDRGILTFYGGTGLEAHLVLDGCSRDLFLSGGFSGFDISIVSQNCATSGIRLEPNSAAGTAVETIKSGNIVINSTGGLSPVNLAPSGTASFAGILKDVTISGHVDNIGAASDVQAVPIFQFKHVDSILEYIDMSGLTVTHDAGDGTNALEIEPDVAATCRHIQLPKVIGTINANGNLVRINDTNSATIEYIEVNHIEGLRTSSGYLNFQVDNVGNAVKFLTIRDKDFPTGSTAGQAINIAAGDQITVDGNTATKGITIAAACTNVYPGKNSINDGGWVYAVQTLTGAGAVDIISPITEIVTDGVNALTLVDGVDGQQKWIVMKTDVDVGTLTPDSLGNGTTITFDDVGDSADLFFTNAAWFFMGGTATLA